MLKKKVKKEKQAEINIYEVTFEIKKCKQTIYMIISEKWRCD